MQGSPSGCTVGWATRAAMTWCVTFAAVHLFWAFGGSIGLASSAGSDLAHQRPTSFVVFGLYGVAALLLAGSAALPLTAVARIGRRRTAALVVLACIGSVLMVRGVGLEILLAADVGGVRQQIGPLETHWSQVLWNPWFVLGGCLFIASSLHAYRHSPGRPFR